MGASEKPIGLDRGHKRTHKQQSQNAYGDSSNQSKNLNDAYNTPVNKTAMNSGDN